MGNSPQHVTEPSETRQEAGVAGCSPKPPRLTISEFAALFGLEENVIRERIEGGRNKQEYYSIRELAERWRVSRGTVYNRLRAAGAKVLDFAAPGKRGKKVVSVRVVLQIEARKTKKLC